MREIKIKCPAKINLTLEILDKRKDGFHNIQSVMQTINLFDFLTVKIQENQKNCGLEIKLSGTNDEIPYDENNLVYKAAKLFFEKIIASSAKPFGYSADIHIEKNIPVAAGLAGGSTDAAGTLRGLNELFDNILSETELHKLCAKLGSDLNFCLAGGCRLATSRGEILEPLPFQEFRLALIKPEDLSINAKEAYKKFSKMKIKPDLNMTSKLIKALKSEESIIPFLHNDLEIALINDYTGLLEIKKLYPKAIMSGSGSAFFAIEENFSEHKNFWTKNTLKSINSGVYSI